MAIPKIVHFTWKTKTLTRFAQRIWREWEKTNPDWELRLWDDAEIRALVAEHYPQHLETFDSYPSGIFRADAFRFFVLHKFGGVYADLDVLPYRNINELVERTECFVGAEPEKHVRDNEYLRGMPMSLCNAFMGSVPGHVFWERCFEALARCVCTDVVDATGPRFVNGVALTIPREQRPDALPPSYWSPLAGDGRKYPTPDTYCAALEKHFRLVGRGEPALVSHLWRNSWFMPIPYKGPAFWKIPNSLQWAWRQRRSGEISRVRFTPPTVDYDLQDFKPVDELPSLYVAVDLSEGSSGNVVAALAGVDYPRDRLAFGLFATDDATEAAGKLAAIGFSVEVHRAPAASAERHNAMLEAGDAYKAVVLIDGRLTHIPKDALRLMLAARRPVVGINVHAADGSERNESSFLYHRDAFKRLYRAVQKHGTVPPIANRAPFSLSFFRYLDIAPLTSVGADLMLIRKKVVAAGVRFAAEPYKFHLDVEAFCLMARDKGFEVCALANEVAITTRPERTA
ncbi:glycosyltransferase family 32 protein [Devosia soli]|uniref:glycosyltransferase family 32 protein n=1 Tax=Devosia soli TaxID=361041 RepID=UPI00069C4D59|nr:glycosyltransferase [Devosia soli]